MLGIVGCIFTPKPPRSMLVMISLRLSRGFLLGLAGAHLCNLGPNLPGLIGTVARGS